MSPVPQARSASERNGRLANWPGLRACGSRFLGGRPFPLPVAVLFFQLQLLVAEGLGDRPAIGIDAGQEFNFLLGSLEKLIAVLKVLDPLFVPRQRLRQPQVPLLELVDDVFQFSEGLFEGGSLLGRRIVRGTSVTAHLALPGARA